MNRKEELEVLIKHVKKDMAKLTDIMTDDEESVNIMLDEKVLLYQQYRKEFNEL